MGEENSGIGVKYIRWIKWGQKINNNDNVNIAIEVNYFFSQENPNRPNNYLENCTPMTSIRTCGDNGQ